MKKYSWILGAFFLLFGAVPVMAAEETPEAVEAGYILESPTEEGRDVFIQAGGEDSELSDVLLTIREEGREVQVEGEAISNVAAFHLSDAAELICMEGRLDGRAFRRNFRPWTGRKESSSPKRIIPITLSAMRSRMPRPSAMPWRKRIRQIKESVFWKRGMRKRSLSLIRAMGRIRRELIRPGTALCTGKKS